MGCSQLDEQRGKGWYVDVWHLVIGLSVSRFRCAQMMAQENFKLRYRSYYLKPANVLCSRS